MFMEGLTVSDNAVMVRNVSVKLGRFELNVDTLDIKKGFITGLIGKNGAGKTTLIKTVLDCIQPESGEILFDGVPMWGHEAVVKAKTAVVYDTLIYPQHLTATKTAKIISPFYDFDWEIFHRLLERFGLRPHMRLSSYSRGMQVKFSVTMALAHNPEILFLDEPTSGLDPTARDDMLDVLLEFIQDENKTVFFSTHITSDLDKIADYIALIENGRVVFNEVKDDMLDRFAMAHVEREALTDDVVRCLSGLKENAFGCVGLCADRALLQGKPGVRLARPTVEDIMIFRTKDRDNGQWTIDNGQ
ncbi:MAG: ABC transporter ATP-binding protein [Peptococcaceae bacterium]|nr:ABC transporter ATP-binding protein [Peptococcaceae bacterium]